MFLRGLDTEGISAELGAPEGAVALWVAERAARATGEADPKRAQLGDKLRLLERTLHAFMGQADLALKPKFATAIAGIASKLYQIDGRCGARKRGGGFCNEYPMRGRTRCRVHGGASPVGAESGTYLHGRRSRYASPLSDEEEVRFEEYKRQLYDAAEDIAWARVQRDRAIARGESGVPETNALNRLLRTHTLITKGMTVVHVADEASVTRLMDVLMPIIERGVNEGVEKRLTGAQVLARIAIDAQAVDWRKVSKKPN